MESRMDEQAFSFLKTILSKQDDEIQEIKSDVKKLLKFKWQIIGGSLFFSFILTSAINLAVIYFQRG
jgi:hypothetical protein